MRMQMICVIDQTNRARRQNVAQCCMPCCVPHCSPPAPHFKSFGNRNDKSCCPCAVLSVNYLTLLHHKSPMSLSDRGRELHRPHHLLLCLAAGLAVGAAALARRLQASRTARQRRAGSRSQSVEGTAAAPTVMSSSGTVGSTGALPPDEHGEAMPASEDIKPAKDSQTTLAGPPTPHVTPAEGQPTCHSSQEAGLPQEPPKDVQKAGPIQEAASAAELLIKAAYPAQECSSKVRPLPQEQGQGPQQVQQTAQQQKQQLSVVGKSLRRAFARKAAKR